MGADWCPWCRKLEAEIARPEVQKALESWTLVVLDVDKDRHDAESLGAGSIPALRMVIPAGQVVASHDGYLTAAQLTLWLDEKKPLAGDLPPAELSESGAPSAVGVVRLVRQLDQSDALLREAAINRLEGYPGEAAGPVTEAFATGSLQTRLAALELLGQWKAPIAAWTMATGDCHRRAAQVSSRLVRKTARAGCRLILISGDRLAFAASSRRSQPGNRPVNRSRSGRCRPDQ